MSMFFYKKNRAIGFLDAPVHPTTGSSDPPIVTAPVVTPPKETDDYLTCHFRALSQTLARKMTDQGILILDFTTEHVLQEATPLWNGIGIYPNHEHDVEKWKGVITEAVWKHATETLPIPGVNVTAKLWRGIYKGNVICPDDFKTAKGIADGITTHVSSGIIYEYKQSHDLPPHSFFSSLGEDRDGSQIRLIVTKMQAVIELSLVVVGADHTARLIDASAMQLGLGREDLVASVIGDHLAIHHKPTRFFSGIAVEPPPPLPPPAPSSSKDILALETALSTSEHTATVLNHTVATMRQELDTHKTALHETEQHAAAQQQTLLTALHQKSDEVQSLRNQVETLTDQLAVQTPLADIGTSHVTTLRDQTKRAYLMFCTVAPTPVSDAAKSATLSLIENATPDLVNQMLNTFTSRALTRIPLKRVSQHALAATSGGSYFGTRLETHQRFFSPSHSPLTKKET
jgi:hypothetical protein